MNNTIKWSQVVAICLLLISCSSKKTVNNTNASQHSSSKTNKPNVIIILADDAGYIDFGFMGSEDLKTPNIDKLAEGGVVFTDAHVSSTVCAPSRAGLMTGKYQQRFGFEANGTGKFGLSDDVKTMADMMKTNGYKTYALGKWHLGSAVSDQPNQRGFDDFYGFLAGSRSYFEIKNPSEDKMLQHNGRNVEHAGYMTDILGDEAVKYAEQSKDEPFFMYLAFNAVHTPMEAKTEDLERFKNHPRQELAAMTWSLDENVGKLIHKLEDLGIRDNTLIYFLSDNGGSPENTSKNGPLKGFKGNEFEGGHRVPFVVSWPAKIKGGVKFNGLSSSLDIFPTSLAAGGITKPTGLLLDGANLLPFLMDKKTGVPHHMLFWRKLEESSARIGDQKLISLERYGSVMYNLKNDLGETKDISKTNKKIFDEIMSAYKNWESKMMPPLWDEGKDWMPFTWNLTKTLMQNKPIKYRTLHEQKRKEKK
ncbi:sulfatase-like hydrolase/transferase [Pedobacter arcticus]|uniref:sulfatase-like hydrolase/transferase n=1 Tax=Pedobacter arcticus TaxID=752140 RepID=UPI0003666408|nr:sulfatase-like hydrolase/transferase [Pedobacter arcticus]